MPDFKDSYGDDDEELDDGDSATGGESTEPKEPSKPSDKRISDLQSAKDKETARANKLQKQLDDIAAAAKGNGAEDSKPPSGGESFIDNGMLDVARMFAYQQNPKLSEYGIGMSDLAGSTPGEITANATALVAQFQKVETQIRNKVLADNNLSPELSDAPPPQKRDYSKMKSEDFNKLVEDAMAGRI